jgi:hypothetical protein
MQGFLVCGEVFKDVRTGEFILLGPTSYFRLRGFPCKLPVMGFLQMVEAHGHFQFSAALLDPEEEQVWSWSAPGSLCHPEPLVPHQIVFPDWVLNVPRPGVTGWSSRPTVRSLCRNRYFWVQQSSSVGSSDCLGSRQQASCRGVAVE